MIVNDTQLSPTLVSDETRTPMKPPTGNHAAPKAFPPQNRSIRVLPNFLAGEYRHALGLKPPIGLLLGIGGGSGPSSKASSGIIPPGNDESKSAGPLRIIFRKPIRFIVPIRTQRTAP